jgi:hypothetical protein
VGWEDEVPVADMAVADAFTEGLTKVEVTVAVGLDDTVVAAADVCDVRVTEEDA